MSGEQVAGLVIFFEVQLAFVMMIYLCVSDILRRIRDKQSASAVGQIITLAKEHGRLTEAENLRAAHAAAKMTEAATAMTQRAAAIGEKAGVLSDKADEVKAAAEVLTVQSVQMPAVNPPPS